MDSKRMKKIMIITHQGLPVPSVGGGAVQQLITNLLNVNEEKKKVKFIVTSCYDARASKIKFSYSKVYFFKNRIIRSPKSIYLLIRCIFWHIGNLIRGKKITSLKRDPIGFYTFQHRYIAKKEKVDVVVLENVPNSEVYVSLKDIVGEDNVYNHLHWVRVGKMNERQAVPNSISSGKYGKREWVKEEPAFGNNYVLYDGINIQDFSKPLPNRFAERKKIGFNEQDIVVLFCGRFVPEKGISQLLEAFDRLIEHKDIKLLLIGSANYSKNIVTNYSKAIIEKANKMENVVLLGYVPNEEMPKYYSVSDIITIPSLCHEAAGLVAIEGMAAGSPLIITQSGSMVEYVNDECAIKLPIDSELSNNLEKTIIELAENASLREKMGEAGKKRALNYSSEIFYENFLKIFENNSSMNRL